DGIAPARQTLSARTTCRVVIWTRAKPDAACANLIEIYPANPGAPPLPERWVDRLVKHLKNGQPPEAALRHIVWEDQKKGDRLSPGSLRLRNGTSKWSSQTYASPYYRDKI